MEQRPHYSVAARFPSDCVRRPRGVYFSQPRSQRVLPRLRSASEESMRPIGAFVLLATVALFAAGCGSSSDKPAEAPPPAAPAEGPNLLARLADAQALTDTKARDDALVKVATAAAKEGDVEVVEKALR